MEFVLVVPRADLFGACYPQGFVSLGEPISEQEFETAVDGHGFFVQREHAEENPALKQIIPYSVVVRGSEVFLMRRLARGGEARLHNKLSIGVGGHINPVDSETGHPDPNPSDRNSVIDSGARREIQEELTVEGDLTLRRVGILNDDSNPVGAVHVGLVHVALAEGDVRVREEEVLEGEFVALSALREMRAEGANFETWSALLIDHLHEVVPHLAAVS